MAYYSIDTDRYFDRRIKKLKNKHRANGLVVYDYILCEIYRDKGCYVDWSEDLRFDISDYFAIDENEIETIVLFCAEIGLFDKLIFDERKKITSKSIQNRFLDFAKKMKRTVLDVPKCIEIQEETAKIQEEISKLPEFLDERKKEKKGKERKESIMEIPEKIEKFRKPTIDEISNYLKEKNITSFTAEKFHAYYESKGWLIGKSPMKSWKAAVTTWTTNNSGFTNGNKPLNNIGLANGFSGVYDESITEL